MSNTTDIERIVMKQALIEYAVQRAGYGAFDGSPINDTVETYVNVRYATHPPAFRADKIKSLVPRVEAAVRLVNSMDASDSWDMVFAGLSEGT